MQCCLWINWSDHKTRVQSGMSSKGALSPWEDWQKQRANGKEMRKVNNAIFNTTFKDLAIIIIIITFFDISALCTSPSSIIIMSIHSIHSAIDMACFSLRRHDPFQMLMKGNELLYILCISCASLDRERDGFWLRLHFLLFVMNQGWHKKAFC